MDIITFVMISAFLNVGGVMSPAPCGLLGRILNLKYSLFKLDEIVKSPRSVILRSGATKNLNDIRFFAIAQNDKRVFFRLFTRLSN